MPMKAESLAEYNVVKCGVGWRDLTQRRSRFAAVGPDRVSFLHALLSNDISSLRADSGVYTTLLTPTGKILADFYCYRLEDQVLIDVRADLSDRLISKLREYIIMDEVEFLELGTVYGHISLQGSGTAELLGCTFADLSGLSPLGLVRSVWEGHPVRVIRKDELSTPGFEILLPREVLPEFLAWMNRPDIPIEVRELGEESYGVLRLERGIPVYGVDMSERNNPLEAGIRDAYSLTKGCFVGQEVVAKATNIGGVARLLSRIRGKTETVPEAGSKIYSQEGQEIGWITSAGYSPKLGSSIALGYVKRIAAVPNSDCCIESGSGRVPARIVGTFE